MDIVHNGEHQICFWKITQSTDKLSEIYIDNPVFSWDDLHMIPTSRPYISVGKANYTIVKIPHSSARLNITDVMPGGMTYESRTGTWEFKIDHGYWGKWTNSYNEFAEFFHGARMFVSLMDDPTKIFKGRTKIESYTPGESYSTIKISYDLDAEPIKISEAQSDLSSEVLRFRIRFINVNGKVLKETYYRAGKIPAYSGKPTNPYSENYEFYKWDPSIVAVEGNADYHATYYYKQKIELFIEDDDPSYIPKTNSSGISSHPIIYIIEDDPDVSAEASYEMPDNVKFMFNDVNHSIDVLGSEGSLIKKLYYTPENMEIERTT